MQGTLPPKTSTEIAPVIAAATIPPTIDRISSNQSAWYQMQSVNLKLAIIF